ncbi:MAG: hypothetical protein WC878_05890 [Candidatus Paceibacterota bacterium]|jgi:hypothetical protein
MAKRKKLNQVESLILSKHQSMHPKPVSGPASVIRQVNKFADYKLNVLRKVVDDRSVKAFEELTLGEKIEAIEGLIDAIEKKKKDMDDLRVSLLMEKYTLEKIFK